MDFFKLEDFFNQILDVLFPIKPHIYLKLFALGLCGSGEYLQS
jgi:hypothetical protein